MGTHWSDMDGAEMAETWLNFLHGEYHRLYGHYLRQVPQEVDQEERVLFARGQVYLEFMGDIADTYNDPVPEDEFVIHSVVGRRDGHNGDEVLVLWRDYGPDEATWQPADDIPSAYALAFDVFDYWFSRLRFLAESEREVVDNEPLGFDYEDHILKHLEVIIDDESSSDEDEQPRKKAKVSHDSSDSSDSSSDSSDTD
jgi:hypothetical protein